MKKLISLSIFIVMVVLALLARNTADAQVVVRPVVAAAPVMVRPVCPGPGYVWARGGWVLRPRFHRPYGFGPRWYARPVRVKRYRW